VIGSSSPIKRSFAISKRVRDFRLIRGEDGAKVISWRETWRLERPAVRKMRKSVRSGRARLENRDILWKDDKRAKLNSSKGFDIVKDLTEDNFRNESSTASLCFAKYW